MQQRTIDTPEGSNNKPNWFKNLGILGFTFFLVKGIAWLAVTAWIIN